MLFNSPEFILVFLPLVLAVSYFLAARANRTATIAWMVTASCFFYGWFSAKLLLLLGASIIFNYVLGSKLSVAFKRRKPLRNGWLVFGIVANLAVLAYFKYANFFLENLNYTFGQHFVWHQVVLPIGISFFTFQKIAFLTDASRGEAEDYDFLSFCLFVMYFPQLIAGPIVHHKDLIPQLQKPSAFRFEPRDFAAGMTLFVCGLAKKIFVADNMAVLSDAVFKAANDGATLGPADAWTGGLAFTFQIYFDFSGYSDMAIGLALMSGIRLPANFNSPYQARSVIEFWRRWHMSLSRFIRDYVYLPLGGNRLGKLRRYVNLMLTMVVGGLWHGAAWTFVAWGALHGVLLIVNHAWRYIVELLRLQVPESRAHAWVARAVVFLAVVIAWVFFRAPTFDAAWSVCLGMVGADPGSVKLLPHISPAARAILFAGLLVWVWGVPNSWSLLHNFNPVLESARPPLKSAWICRWMRGLGLADSDGQPALGTAAGVLAGALVVSLLVYQSVRGTTIQQFIYFQF